MTAECACYYMQQRCFSVTVSEPVTAGPGDCRDSPRLRGQRSAAGGCNPGAPGKRAAQVVTSSSPDRLMLAGQADETPCEETSLMEVLSVLFFSGHISSFLSQFKYGSFRVDP